MSVNSPYNYTNYSTSFVPLESGRVIYSFLQKNVSNRDKLPVIVLNLNGVLTKDEKTKEIEILIKIGGDEPPFTIDPNRLEGNFNFRTNTYNARKYVKMDYKPREIILYINTSKLCFSKDPLKNTFSLNVFLNDCSCDTVTGNTYPVVYYMNSDNQTSAVGFLYTSQLDYACGTTNCANPCDCLGADNEICETYWGDATPRNLPNGQYGYCNTNTCIGDSFGNACNGLTPITSYTATEVSGNLPSPPYYYIGIPNSVIAIISNTTPSL